MKKKLFVFFSALTAVVVMGSVQTSKSQEGGGSLRVYDGYLNCYGSGGNCLPTVIITCGC